MNKTASQQQLAALAAKRQKLSVAPRDAATMAATPDPRTAQQGGASGAAELFPGLPRVEYRPEAGPWGPEDAPCYRFYAASERVHGRTMEDWLRPALSLRDVLPVGPADGRGQACSSTTALRPRWDEGSVESYHRRIRTAFELCAKLGIRLWAASDRDLAPEGDSLEETQRGLDEAVDQCLELQQQHRIRPLWLAADLHSHPRYCQGAATAPDAGVVAAAGAQVRRALQAAQRLSAECFLFRGGADGYASPLDTDPARELRGYGRLLRMTAEYRDRLGYRGQLLLETSPPRGGRPTGQAGQAWRYDEGAAASVCLLKQHGLDRHYKLSAPPGHEAFMSTAYGVLGCLDATGQDFPPDLREATLAMKLVVEQGGVQPGGLLVGVPESLRGGGDGGRDVLAACVAVVDRYAKALRVAAKMVADGAFSRNLQQRYLSHHSGFGARLASGEATLEDCEEHARKQQGLEELGHARGSTPSSRAAHWEAVCARYVDATADGARE